MVSSRGILTFDDDYENKMLKTIMTLMAMIQMQKSIGGMIASEILLL